MQGYNHTIPRLSQGVYTWQLIESLAQGTIIMLLTEGFEWNFLFRTCLDHSP